MPRTIIRIPFEGTPPDVRPGDAVEVRDAGGTWHRATCGSEPRYDDANALGRRSHLTVSVRFDHERSWVNWPAQDVRLWEARP